MIVVKGSVVVSVPVTVAEVTVVVAVPAMSVMMTVVSAEPASSHSSDLSRASAVDLSDTSVEAMGESVSLASDPSLLESASESEFLTESHSTMMSMTGSVNHANSVSSSRSVMESVVVSDLASLVQSESGSSTLSVSESVVVAGVLALGKANSESLQRVSEAVALEPFRGEEAVTVAGFHESVTVMGEDSSVMMTEMADAEVIAIGSSSLLLSGSNFIGYLLASVISFGGSMNIILNSVVSFLTGLGGLLIVVVDVSFSGNLSGLLFYRVLVLSVRSDEQSSDKEESEKLHL
ncbi:hypothetical protein PENTCL1PPCAC_16136, partial [Pristionchus entomophagus]